MMEKAEALMEDIDNFAKTNGASRLVMIWCGSTEVFHRPAKCTRRWRHLKRAWWRTTRTLRRAMVYAYAALKKRRTVRQRRAESDARHSGAAGTGERQ